MSTRSSLNRHKIHQNKIREYSVELGLRTHRPSVLTSAFDPFSKQSDSATIPDHWFGNDTSYHSGSNYFLLADHENVSQCSNKPTLGESRDWWKLPGSSNSTPNYEQRTKNVKISYSANEIYGKANVKDVQKSTNERQTYSNKLLSQTNDRNENGNALKDTPRSSSADLTKGTRCNSQSRESAYSVQIPSFQCSKTSPTKEVSFGQSKPQELMYNGAIDEYLWFTNRNGYPVDSKANQSSNQHFSRFTLADNGIKLRTFEEAMNMYPSYDSSDDSESESHIRPMLDPPVNTEPELMQDENSADCDRISSPLQSLSDKPVVEDQDVVKSHTTEVESETLPGQPITRSAWEPSNNLDSKESTRIPPCMESSGTGASSGGDTETISSSSGEVVQNTVVVTNDLKSREDIGVAVSDHVQEAGEAEMDITLNGSSHPEVQENMNYDLRDVLDPPPYEELKLNIDSRPQAKQDNGNKISKGNEITKKAVRKKLLSPSKKADRSMVPPIDLSQLSPKSSKSNRKLIKSSAPNATSLKSKSVNVQVGTNTRQRPKSALNSSSLDTPHTKQIAREIKLRVQRKPKEIANEIKRRVQQNSKKDRPIALPPPQQGDSNYANISERRLSNSSQFSLLNSFRGYERYKEMTPRIELGEVSIWQCLPDELWLHILQFVPFADLHSFMLTCHDFNRISHDKSLWGSLTVNRKELSDEELEKIGNLRPTDLSLVQCVGIKLNGQNVSNRVMGEMFTNLGVGLQRLSIASCVMPPMSGEALLHHAVLHCPNIKSLDTSWCNLSDRDVELIAENFTNLSHLLLNGNQAITSSGLEKVLTQFTNQLEQLEVQGCFKLGNAVLSLMGKCTNLKILNIGQCNRFVSGQIRHGVSKLSKLEELNLRGLKHLKDECLAAILRKCSKVQHLVVSQCSSLTPKSLTEIACSLKRIETLELSSCKDSVTDRALTGLLNQSKALISLDVSATSVTNHTLEVLPIACPQLVELKVNFCAVTDAGIRQLLNSTFSLRKLQTYGVRGIVVDELLELNSHVVVEN